MAEHKPQRIPRPSSKLACWVCGKKWWMVESLFRCVRSHDACV